MDYDFMLNTEYSKRMMKHLNHPASDDVAIEYDVVREIKKRLNVKLDGTIPADLVITGQLPITDVKVKLIGEGEAIVNGEPKKVTEQEVRFRLEPPKKVKGTMSVGFIAFPANGGYMTADVVVEEGKDYLSWGGLGYAKNGVFLYAEQYSDNEEEIRRATEDMGSWLAIWYVIEIALLHPQIREAIPSPKREAKTVWKGKRRNKRTTTYVRKHYIRKNAVTEAIGGGKRTRRTLAWYVIGHWRHYKDGHTVFIKGYWKGALREMHQNVDEGRDRTIAVKGETA